MKILAIRGKNLASLAGEFTIDFEAPPLASAGLFAIVGATGAGKSTLLDAICLALFDRTPRLSKSGGALIGLEEEDEKKRLGAQDVRALLRKGTASGFAEVDFYGADRGRYRARWSVRRARDRPDGTLGKQSVELTDLATSSPIGGTKTEVLAAIEERLGLSFDQFRRSALLAQGEFAAFLRADEKDRASLLEQMTGSEIYSRVSMAAFKRASEERAKLDAIRGRLADLVVLDAPARDLLVADRARVTGELEAARGQINALEKARQWHETATRLRVEREAAAKAQQAASALWDASAEERALLAQVKNARPLEGPIGKAASAARALVDATSELTKAREEEERGQRAVVDAEQAAKVATEAAGRARDEARDRVPEVEEARRLDAEVAAAAAPLGTAMASLRMSRDALDKARRALRPVAQENADVRAQLEGIDASPLARVSSALLEVRRIVTGACEASEATLVQTKTALAAADQALGAVDVAALRKEREGHTERTANWKELRDVRAERWRIEESIRTEEAEATAANVLAESSRAARDAAHAEVVTTEARLEEARRSLEVARAALGLADRRADLREGEACPLCGSKEHPWREGEAPGARVVEPLAARVDTLQREKEAQAKRETTASIEHAQAIERARASRERRDALGASRVTAKGRHDRIAQVLGVALPADDAVLAEAPAWLVSGEAVLVAAGAELRRREDDGEARTGAAREARKKSDAAQARVDRDRDARRLADAACEAAARALADEAQVAALTGERDARQARRAKLLGGVATLAFEQAAQAALARAEGGAEKARAFAEAARLASVAAEAKHEAALRGRGVAEVTELTQREARDRALADARLDLETARALLAHDARWEAEHSAHQETLRLEVHGAGEILKDRTTRLEAHEATGAPLLDRAAVESALSAAHAAHALIEEQHARVVRQIENDDVARARRGEREDELRAQESAAHVWEQMNELIGSADGKKLRVFAQSLTFDALLEQANAHLKDISRRYSLMRVPGSDLELQVRDHDMADEVRAVTSLSGGESFLVSLALALGLSTLGGQRARVESLFVDEGFGTLDPETLEVAIASLEALQATGCQVGIISHVPGLAERFSACVRVERRGPGRSAVVLGHG